MKYKSFRIFMAASIVVCGGSAMAETYIAELSARGKALYFERVSCWVCHGDVAEGRVGPSLQYGPTPLEIQEQLDSNPQMAVIVNELDPDADDVIALSVFIGELAGKSTSAEQISGWQDELETYMESRRADVTFALTPRDKKVLEIQSFDTVLEDWQRRAKTGSLKRNYDVRVIATYENGDPVFRPEPDRLYFYQNTGTAARMVRGVADRAQSTQVVVGDAESKEVLVSREMPAELRGAVHTTVLSPDARYVYIIGPSTRLPMVDPDYPGNPMLRTPATMLKVDALTLQPVKQLAIGGRLHHGQIFQDRYLLLDTFNSDPDGLDVFLFDPVTDTIVGGIRAEDLGGRNYTAYTDDRFIYVLMQPGEFEGAGADFHAAARGRMTALRPYWVAKIDPANWEVVAEYPYAGYRGDWIIIDSKSEYLYVPAASSATLTKINIASGEVVWSTPTGTGPYGGTLSADESEIWIANKGEATGFIGRTITVIETASGRGLETVFSGYMVDHVLLSPNGKEMWATSNGEGRIYVFDAETREKMKVIDMPHRGDPHGLVWVIYDENGNGRVVRDQGGFHNGVHPARGRPLHR